MIRAQRAWHRGLWIVLAVGMLTVLVLAACGPRASVDANAAGTTGATLPREER